MSLANLGGLMLYKEPKKALEYLLEADKLLPKNSKILYNIGNAYHAMGETEKSLETIEKVIQFDPEFEHTYGQYYMKLRHFAR
jgi:tetratricopeptide (TPR) repeat protein